MLNFHHTNHHNKTPILMQFVFVMCFAQALWVREPLKVRSFRAQWHFPSYASIITWFRSFPRVAYIYVD